MLNCVFPSHFDIGVAVSVTVHSGKFCTAHDSHVEDLSGGGIAQREQDLATNGDQVVVFVHL